MKALDSGQWQSQRNWKDIFATELAAGVEKSYLKVCTTNAQIIMGDLICVIRDCDLVIH